jgi:FHS family L-fucose permease-like MFS transporter
MENKTNQGALFILTTVFFFWGFIAAGNSVFIPFCKNYFSLDQFQSQLIDFAFYLAYYLGALSLFVFGSFTGKDLVGQWGYKKSIVYGLSFSALGALAMIISVYLNIFSGMLFGLFIVALGFSLQQTSANPFMIALGDEATGSNRINLGGGINSLGTTVGPLIVALALFGTATAISDEMIESLELFQVIILYACVGGLFLGVAILFNFSKKLPSGISNEKPEKAKKAMVTLLVITGLLIACFSPVFGSYLSEEQKQIEKLELQLKKLPVTNEIKNLEKELDLIPENKLESQHVLEAKIKILKKSPEIEIRDSKIESLKDPLDKNRMIWLSAGLLVIIGGLLFAHFKGKSQKINWGAMMYPQLTLGMLAIFVYVGVEVAIGSNLGELLKKDSFGGYGSSEIAPFIAMFWGSLMIGRWAGSINAFDLSTKMKNILRFFVPLMAFFIVLVLTSASGYDVSPLYWYILCVLIQIAAFFITNDKPALTLGLFGILGIVSTVIGVMTSGIIAIYSFLSAGLFLSIMWPCIFSLSISGLGKYQTQGSAFLVMMILGGAIIPPIQGKIADVIGIQQSFFIGILCFLYLTFFAWLVNKNLSIND